MPIEPGILIFILVGFLAQVVDGTLGMGYGVLSTSVLLSLGLPPAIASASVHTAEVFVTGVSGLAHLGNGNVERHLVLRLMIPGVLGGGLGSVPPHAGAGGAGQAGGRRLLIGDGGGDPSSGVHAMRSDVGADAPRPPGVRRGIFGFRGRRGVGTDRHLHAAGARSRTTIGYWIGQSHGVLRHRGAGGDILRSASMGSLAGGDRVIDRRRVGCSSGGLRVSSAPGARRDGAGRHVDPPLEPAHDLSRPGVSGAGLARRSRRKGTFLPPLSFCSVSAGGEIIEGERRGGKDGLGEPRCAIGASVLGRRGSGVGGDREAIFPPHL